eukprot:jgi/Psemu1/37614/gm1.37614_g
MGIDYFVCLPFIGDARLTCVCTVSSSLANPLTTPPALSTQNLGTTTANIQDLHSDEVTSEYTIHPATLSDASKALFQKHAFRLTAAFNDKINCLAKQCCANNVLSFVNITRGQLDLMFLHVIGHFVVMHTPLESSANVRVLPARAKLRLYTLMKLPVGSANPRPPSLLTGHRWHTLASSSPATISSSSSVPSHATLSTGLCIKASSCFCDSTIPPGSDYGLSKAILLPFVVLASDPKLLHHVEHNAALPPEEFWLANSAFPTLLQLVEQAAYGNNLNPFTSIPSSFLWWPHHKNALLKADACKVALTTPTGDYNSKRQQHQKAPKDSTCACHSSHNQARQQGLFAPPKPECASITVLLAHFADALMPIYLAHPCTFCTILTSTGPFAPPALFYTLPLRSSLAHSSTSSTPTPYQKLPPPHSGS